MWVTLDPMSENICTTLQRYPSTRAILDSRTILHQISKSDPVCEHIYIGNGVTGASEVRVKVDPHAEVHPLSPEGGYGAGCAGSDSSALCPLRIMLMVL